MMVCPVSDDIAKMKSCYGGDDGVVNKMKVCTVEQFWCAVPSCSHLVTVLWTATYNTKNSVCYVGVGIVIMSRTVHSWCTPAVYSDLLRYQTPARLTI